MTLPYSTRLTRPLTISPMRSLYSSYWRSRSASRTFWTMTCLADCAAMRPKSKGGSVSAMASPTCGGRVAAPGVVERDLDRVVVDLVDHEQVARQAQLAGLRVDLGVDVRLGAVARAGGLRDRVLHRGDDDRAVDHLLAGDRVGDLQELEPVGADRHGVYSSDVRRLGPRAAAGPRVACPARCRLVRSSAVRPAGSHPARVDLAGSALAALPRRSDSRIRSSVRTRRASPMSRERRAAATASSPSLASGSSSSAASPSTPRMMPRKRLRPLERDAPARSSPRGRPSARNRCARTSGRSMPGEETSRL